MGRLDQKRGRFNSDWETFDISQGLRGWQQAVVGSSIDYYRFDRNASEMNDVYDEADGVGKIFHPPVSIPVLHVSHSEGGNEDTDSGFYFNDNIYVSASFDELYRAGLTLVDLQAETFLKDRFAYDGRLWRITQINVLGQIQSRDLIASIEGTQIKPDELVNDPQFQSQER